MNDSDFMLLAIKASNSSQETIPVGVVIVKDGVLLATSHNSQHLDHDMTSHAELKALRIAERQLNNKNITGCTLYTTCEPCTMCASALFYANISKIVYGASMADIDPDNTRIMLSIEELSLKMSKPPIVIQLMRDECFKRLYK